MTMAELTTEYSDRKLEALAKNLVTKTYLDERLEAVETRLIERIEKSQEGQEGPIREFCTIRTTRP
jgi:hypothetical protein